MALPTAASVISSGLASYPSVYYDRTALDTLRANLMFYPACDLKQMPEKNGVAMKIFGYTAFGANTTGATEGTPGAGQALSQVQGTINLTQYVDYASFSDKSVLTGISDVVAEGAKELAFRGAISVDTVILTAIDTAAAADAVARIDAANGTTFMSAALSRQASGGLRSVNIRPKADGKFFGIMPAVASFDLQNDSAAGGWLDLNKYAENTVKVLQEGIQGNYIGSINGVEWFESNNVTTVTNYLSTGKTAYHSYVIGNQAFVASSLGKTKLGDKNFTVSVGEFKPGTNSLDPAGLIAAAASYNFYFGVTKNPNTVSGFRRITACSLIG